MDEQAIEWVVRLTSNDLDEQTVSTFRQWYSENSQHKTALKQAIELWLEMGRPFDNHHNFLNLNEFWKPCFHPAELERLFEDSFLFFSLGL